MFGAVLNRLATSVRRALSQYAVGANEPELALNFIDNEYITNNSTSTFASAVTHARAGNATMTDGYGPNVVVNGTFDSGLSSWTTGAGSSSVTWLSSGCVFIDRNGGSYEDHIQQTLSVTAGKSYIVSFQIKDVSHEVGVRIDGSTQGSTFSSKGTGEVVFNASSSSVELGFGATGSTSATVEIDSVSVREMPVIKWGPHNLLRNSEDLSAFTLQNATVTNNDTTAPDGTQTADKLVSDSGSTFHLALSPTTGVNAKATGAVFLKADEFRYGGVVIRVNSATDRYAVLFDLQTGAVADTLSSGSPLDPFYSIEDVGNGWYLCSVGMDDVTDFALVVSGHPTDTISDINFSHTGDGSSGIYAWGAHLYRSDLGGMVDNPERGDSYVPTTSAAVYLPRIGHHVYNGSAWVNEGVLAESEARTNILPKSGEFNTWSTRIKVTVTDDAEISPDGTQSASTVVPTAVSGEHYVQYDLTSNTGTFTDSAYVKADGYKRVFIRPVHVGATEGATQNVEFDVEAGTVLNAPSGTTGTIQDIGNGWYRIAATYTVSGTITGAYGFRVQILENTGAGSFTGDGTSGIQVYGAQREEASTPSSLIPTSGSTVTRAAETFTIPSANLPWSGTAVSIGMEGRVTYADTGSSVEVYLYYWNLDADNFIRSRIRTDSTKTGQLQPFQEALGTQDGSATSDTYFSPDVLVPYNTASRHGSTFIQGAESGVSFSENSTPTALPDLSSTDLNLAYTYMGTIGTFRVWDKDITDDGLVEATNPSLEPSLSLTFEGTGTNSFVVNDWSE